MTKGHYYRRSDQAGGSSNKPLEFASVAAATQFALKKHLPDAEVALRWDGVNRETGTLSLREHCELDDEHWLTIETWKEPTEEQSGRGLENGRRSPRRRGTMPARDLAMAA